MLFKTQQNFHRGIVKWVILIKLGLICSKVHAWSKVLVTMNLQRWFALMLIAYNV